MIKLSGGIEPWLLLSFILAFSFNLAGVAAAAPAGDGEKAPLDLRRTTLVVSDIN